MIPFSTDEEFAICLPLLILFCRVLRHADITRYASDELRYRCRSFYAMPCFRAAMLPTLLFTPCAFATPYADYFRHAMPCRCQMIAAPYWRKRH